MVNFHDPKVVQADTVALERFVLILDGIFLWEFFTTLDFDWNYLATKKKFKWPTFLYLTCRICSLGVVICNFIGDNVTHQINCQLFLSLSLILIATSFACASLLITIRVIAIWNYNFLVTAVTVGICAINIVFLLYCTAIGRAKWSNESRACTTTNDDYGRYCVTVTTVTDIVQLIIMLIGLLRTRGVRHGLIRHLYVQGLVWLAAATIAETPTAVLMLLDLNPPWNAMFQMFSLYSMIICATRMFRDLILYDMDIHEYSEGPKVNGTLRLATLHRKRMAGTLDWDRDWTSGDVTPDRFDLNPAFVSTRTKDTEINLAGLVTPVKGDLESHNESSLVADDDPQIITGEMDRIVYSSI